MLDQGILVQISTSGCLHWGKVFKKLLQSVDTPVLLKEPLSGGLKEQLCSLQNRFFIDCPGRSDSSHLDL